MAGGRLCPRLLLLLLLLGVGETEAFSNHYNSIAHPLQRTVLAAAAASSSSSSSFTSVPRSLPQELWSSLLPLSVGKGLLDDAEPSSETTVAEPPRRANTDALRELALGAVVVLDYAPRLLAANLLGRVLSRAALVCLHAAPDGITSATTTTTITTTLAAAGRTVLSGLEGGWAVANAVLAGALRLALALPLLPRLLFATLWLEAKLKAWGAAIVTRAFDSVDAFAVITFRKKLIFFMRARVVPLEKNQFLAKRFDYNH